MVFDYFLDDLKEMFRNAVNEVTRERAQSFLADDHIQRIVAAYQAFGDEDGFARVVGNDEVREKGSNLSIPLYVRAQAGANGKVAENESAYGKRELGQSIATWQESSAALRKSMDNLFEVLGKQQDHFSGTGKMVPDQFPDTTKLIVASSGNVPRS